MRTSLQRSLVLGLHEEFSEIKELLHRMAFDLGAVSTSDEGGLGEEGRFALGVNWS